MSSGGALAGVRVVELGQGVAGPFASRLLADLGADVVKVEPPGGERGRELAPLIGVAGGRRSALFEYLNWNKRSVEIDLGTTSGVRALRALVEPCDVVIEAFAPGRLELWGCGPQALRSWNDRLVVTSVTNFGRSGPRSSWRSSDLVFYALSGVMHMSGTKWPREPLKHGLRQSLYCAGLNAAYASLVGLLSARRTGTGTHVDLSIAECVTSEGITPLSYYIFTGLVAGRHPQVQDPFGGDPLDMPDGQVAIQAPPACPMGRWADFLGIEELRRPEYVRTPGRIQDAVAIRRLVEERLLTYGSAKRFFRQAAAEGMIAAVVQDAADLLSCEHLAARRFFQPLPGEGMAEVKVPVELAKLSRTPVTVRRAAPRNGEDMAASVAAGWSASRVGRPASAPANRKARGAPLDGLRVVDLSNVVAGPYMGGLLADMGADVVKIEGPQRLDPARVAWGPLVDNDPGDAPWDRGGAFQVLNRGKRSLVCDLGGEVGRAVLVDLLRGSDVLLENFTPRVLRNWGLTPERLAEINPRLITVSNSGYGATGPWRDLRAQGTTLEVMMGISAYTGYPGDRPAKAGQSYPDFIACWSGMLALLAALIERDRSGLGQWIDQGMYQVGAALIPEALLAYQIDGVQPERMGAADFDAEVSGVFETCHDDRWIAVSLKRAADAEGIDAAAQSQGMPGPGIGPDVTADVLRAKLAAWLRDHDAGSAASCLQRAGVAAGPVLSMAEVVADLHLRSRGFFESLDVGDGCERAVFGRPYQMAGLDVRVRRRAPRFGEHNREILRQLGYTEKRIGHLYEQGTVADQPVRPAGAPVVDIRVLTSPSGSFVAADEDYRTSFGGVDVGAARTNGSGGGHVRGEDQEVTA